MIYTGDFPPKQVTLSNSTMLQVIDLKFGMQIGLDESTN